MNDRPGRSTNGTSKVTAGSWFAPNSGDWTWASRRRIRAPAAASRLGWRPVIADGSTEHWLVHPWGARARGNGSQPEATGARFALRVAVPAWLSGLALRFNSPLAHVSPRSLTWGFVFGPESALGSCAEVCAKPDDGTSCRAPFAIIVAMATAPDLSERVVEQRLRNRAIEAVKLIGRAVDRLAGRIGV